MTQASEPRLQGSGQWPTSDVAAIAAKCLEAFESWEERTRTETPDVTFLQSALGPLMAALRRAAEPLGEYAVSGAEGPYLGLMDSVAKREHVPRGDIPWGDYPGGCDTALHLLHGSLERLAGRSVTNPDAVPILIMRDCQPICSDRKDRGGRGGLFAWNEADGVLIFAKHNQPSTPFPQGRKTARQILRRLVQLPSHRAHLSELNDCFEDRNYPRDKKGFDPHIAVIRKWLRFQPHIIWKCVNIQRTEDRVQLVANPEKFKKKMV